MTYAILLAGGVGTRISDKIAKQHIIVDNHQIIEYTLIAFSNCAKIDKIVVVSNPNYIEEVNKFKKKFIKLDMVVSGGDTRIGSVYNGVNAISAYCNDNDKVIISDADRPCITNCELLELISLLDTHLAATTGIENYETLFKIQKEKIVGYIPREGLIRQTSPEAYRYSMLKWLYFDAPSEIVNSYRNIGIDQLFTSGVDIGIVKSNSLNFKITNPEDISLFENIIVKGFDKIINGG